MGEVLELVILMALICVPLAILVLYLTLKWFAKLIRGS